MSIKSIETEYNGYLFRSRLEARWAVFFDGIGTKYQYEPEGYDIDGVRYLPDFYLSEYQIWFEAKGPHATVDDLAKARAFGSADAPIIGLIGDAWYDASGLVFGLKLDDVEIKIAPCPTCDGIGLLYTNGYVCLRCFQGIEASEIRLSERWYNAFLAARQARFEHKAR